MPHLICTAGNDQHLRIWDVRHLSSLSPRATDVLTPPPSAKRERKPILKDENDPLAGESDTANHIATQPSTSLPYEKVGKYMDSAKGKGLLRASYQHSKSCSAAYWDPWGRRILTTSYDDKLRSECFTLPHCMVSLCSPRHTRYHRANHRFPLLHDDGIDQDSLQSTNATQYGT